MIKNLDPQIVWKNFYALTQIPRPSKHEELAVEYMYNWGKEHGLETIKDEVGNIIIRKPATPGCETMIMSKDKQNGGSKPPPYVVLIFFSAFIASFAFV